MIYKQCVLTIANNTATLDEDIYLYRLDKNVELYFTIVNNKYKFDKSDLNNIITKTNASYFQMRLYKNAEVKYTFPLQPTEDGKAILTITDDLIDEPIEVGDYDFQISLLDEDKSSMISMPIASKQLHVCEPLVDVVNESTIDTAAIDTAMVMDTDEAELPVVDSTGKYIPTVWDTKDIISKAKMNHIEQGILQAHTEALDNKIPKVTPPPSNPTTTPTTSELVTFYNELPDSGSVYITQLYYLDKGVIVGYLCDVKTFPETDEDPPYKMITCGATGTYVVLSSAGDLLDCGLCEPHLNQLMQSLENPSRKKGQVLTMTDNHTYHWADAIPHITPPGNHTKSDIATFYKALPDSGPVYITNLYVLSEEAAIGYLCDIVSETKNNTPVTVADVPVTTETGEVVKHIFCLDTGMYVSINPAGDLLDYGLCEPRLNELMQALENPYRKKGQVLTMTDDNTYDWADAIPHITPPEGTEKSDLVTFYKALPDKGLVYITAPYAVNDDVMVGYLCEVATKHELAHPVDLPDESTGDTSQNSKSVACYATGMYVDITSTGVVEGFGMLIPEFNNLMEALTSQTAKKGQVLTMINDNTYDWADTTPQLCIHEVTGDTEVELTLDPYQLIDVTPPDSSSPSITVNILLPTIDELDKHIYKIHLIFMGSSRINYDMPSGMYNCPANDFTADMVYEFIFTYISSQWIVNGSQHKQYSSEPQ